MKNMYCKCHFILAFALINILLTSSRTDHSNQSDRNYQLGVITAFAEMVDADVKRLALSSPLTPEHADLLAEDISKIAQEFNVKIVRESDLIKTTLFPTGIAKDKDVFIIAKQNALDAYEDIKVKLSTASPDDHEEQELIARRFGRLLSYSPKKINQLLTEQTPFRTMTDFGLMASNVFLYYNNLESAERFYSKVLGLKVLSRFDNAVIIRISDSSIITLVDAKKCMHSANEPKTVAIALLTNQLKDWYDYLLDNNVKIKYPYKSKEGNAHDGFVAIDPEGYLLEFEIFKQHPENEELMPILNKSKEYKTAIANKELSFNGSIVWTYHKDLLAMENFYQKVMGLERVVDQGWAKIYQVSESGFIGLVDECRGMHSFTEEKAVTLSFVLEDVDGWHKYITNNRKFEMRTDSISTGPDQRYRSFVGYGPEGYYLEFDKFYEHKENESLMDFLGQ